MKNRALQMSFVKTAPTGADSTTTPTTTIDPEKINQIVKEQTVRLAVVAGVFVAGKMLLRTVCEIAIITAETKIK